MRSVSSARGKRRNGVSSFCRLSAKEERVLEPEVGDKGPLSQVDPQECLFHDGKDVSPLPARYIWNVLFSARGFSPSVSEGPPPTSSPLHSHLSPSPLASNLPTILCFLQFPKLSVLFSPLCFCTCCFICLECLQMEKKNPILLFQPIPAHQQNGLNSASPGKASTNSFKPGAPTRPGCSCWVPMCVRSSSRLRSTGAGATTNLLLGTHLWNWSRRCQETAAAREKMGSAKPGSRKVPTCRERAAVPTLSDITAVFVLLPWPPSSSCSSRPQCPLQPGSGPRAL